MSYEYAIDSYAWIEYFKGTKPGSLVRSYIEGDRAATSALTFAELREKYLREKWKSFPEDSQFIAARTTVVPLSRSIALLAGELNHLRKRAVRDWGMADSVIPATARSESAKVVTGDAHFKGLPDAILV